MRLPRSRNATVPRDVGALRPRRILAVAAAALLVTASAAAGQPATRYDDAPRCATCRIELEPVLAIGPASPDGEPVVLSESPIVSLDAEGRFYVGDRSSGTVFVFTPTGEYVGSFGRSGEGPGEFRSFSGIVDLPGDSVLAVDFGLSRVTVFGPDRQAVHTVPTEANVGVEALRFGDLLVVNPSRAYQRSGRRSPIQALDRAGRVVRGFGPHDPEGPGRPLTTLRALARLDDQRFLAAHKGQYRIEEWRLDGTPLRVFERTIPEFPAVRPQQTCGEDWLPPASLSAIQPSADGRLWVLLTVGDAKWREGAEQMGSEGGCPIFRITDPDKFTDHWLELWDLDAGVVVARAVFDENLAGFVGPDRVGKVEYVGDEVVYRVYRLRVEGER